MKNEEFAYEVNTGKKLHHWFYIHKKSRRAGTLPLVAVNILGEKDGKQIVNVTYEAPANFNDKDYWIYPNEQEWINDIKNNKEPTL